MGNNSAATLDYAVEYPSGEREVHGAEPPKFTISVDDRAQLQQVLTGEDYTAALGFIHGDFDISGDLVAALRLRQGLSHTSWRGRLLNLAARLSPTRLETWFQGRARAARNIRFHYDLPTAFYDIFLDSRHVYSAADFRDARWTLEQAQESKLQHICEDLELRSGERFLDVGCGWGGLVTYAAENYGVYATGCTLSHNQFQFGQKLVDTRGLGHAVSIREMDYRDLNGRFDKIASVGMFEHVGRHRMMAYFRKICSLLESGGMFFNSGIVRPWNVGDDAQTWFVLKRVFPGGELVHLADVIKDAESAGLEILRVKTLRTDYARTCREWVDRLRQRESDCIRLVGEETYRTWLLYLAGSAANFGDNTTSAFSVLMRKP
ncbi:MAG: cyclopropane-fatty-acyl-phospholipid synthase family protein [Bryobacterales bacterium]|nr:cyclopropane-fatty-acyl-phospholipid synthase family protein [Bryobacterales bacterium]